MIARTLAFSLLVSALCSLTAIGQLAEAGALARDGKWEVSIDFEDGVASSSVLAFENYSLPGALNAVIEEIRYVALNNAVVLTVSGLITNELYSVTIENLRRTNNEPIAPVTVGFTTKAMSWTAIGRQELGFAADTVAVGEAGFDLVSGGSQMRDEYDESTFAFEQVTGNFDKKVRILFQEPSSAEARAGLMVRETLDAGRDRPIDPEDPVLSFSRYFQIAANPATTAFSEPGANQFQINVRAFTGFTESLEITNNVTPPGSNTWVRLRRVGDLFEAFWGNDGDNWISLGTYSFPTNDLGGGALPKFSSTAFVGPNFAPEVANIPDSSGERRSFLAQFRSYGDSGLAEPEQPLLSITKVGTQVEVNWQPGIGTLQSTTNLLTGPWSDIPGSSAVLVPADQRQEFFRVRVP